MKNDILQHDRERATPADSPPSPFSAVARLTADWMAGTGFLRFHAAAYAIAGAALLLIDLILNPSDPWAVDVLRVWLILLGSHAVGLVAGWVTWRAVRPHRLIELRHVWTDEEDAGVASAAMGVSVGPPLPLPATGRFTPGRLQPESDADDEQGGLSTVLGALGDAVMEVGDLALAGGTHVRRGMSRVLDWVQGDDEDFDDDEEPEASPEPQPAQTAAARSPARWVVPTGSGRRSAAPAARPAPDPATAQRPPAPIVPIPRPAQTPAASAANERRPQGPPVPTAHPVEPTPLTPRPAKRREVSG